MRVEAGGVDGREFEELRPESDGDRLGVCSVMGERWD